MASWSVGWLVPLGSDYDVNVDAKIELLNGIISFHQNPRRRSTAAAERGTVLCWSIVYACAARVIVRCFCTANA